MKQLTILGIESSCDETAASVYHTEQGVLSNFLHSQIEGHTKFGGVVPEIASRSHLEKIRSIIDTALQDAQKTLDDIDAIAVTSNPGLPGSLLVGVSYAKTLAWAKKKKLIGINHLEGHIFSACIENKIPFPFLCLTASGGHTAMYIVHDYGVYTLIGQTLDDAAGEAFDKVSKLINLGYPGGPIIEKLAQKADFQDYFQYPRPMAQSYDFSFSGLKTAVLYSMIKDQAYDLSLKKFLKNDDPVYKQQVASSLLCAITDMFEQKIKKALKEYRGVQAIAFVGGVACNVYIKNRLKALAQNYAMTCYSPSKEYCTDNGAMIAFVGHYKAQNGEFSDYTLDIFEDQALRV